MLRITFYENRLRRLGGFCGFENKSAVNIIRVSMISNKLHKHNFFILFITIVIDYNIIIFGSFKGQ